MLKLTYLLVFLIGTSLISCEKKTAPPSTGTTTTRTIVKDTVSGKIYTIAGNGYDSAGLGGYSGDGIPAKATKLNYPDGVAIDAIGNIYIADLYNERVRKVNTNGIISTIAGNGTRGYSGDGGLATSAELYYPEGLAVDGSGNVYIVDNHNNRIRKVTASGIISTIAGGGVTNGLGDGGLADSAQLSNPTGITLDGAGNLYIADFGDNLVRKVNTKGIISTVAGGGISGLGDGGPATSAVLYDPSGVAVDALGNIYIASAYGNRIRKVNIGGIISTVAGNSNIGYSGNGGPAIDAELSSPSDVKVDGSGNIFIADANNYCIRKINTSGIISTYAGNGIGGYSGDGGLATAAKIGYIPAIALDGSGNIYITDMDFNRVRVIYK